MDRIICIGDSITYGAWDEKGGWVQRLRAKIEKINDDFLVYNLGINGDTSEDVLNRLEEVERRTVEDSRSIVIVLIGTNDSMVMLRNNTNLVSIEKYKENLRKIITKLKELTKDIFLMTLPPANAFPTSWDKEIGYKNEEIEKYNEAIKEITEEEKVRLIDIRSRFTENFGNFLKDGVHPNSKGHEIIAEKVFEELSKSNCI